MIWNRCKKNINPIMDEHVLDNDVDPFITDYVNSHRNYFTALLGNRIQSKNTLSKNDFTVLKEAYDKSHQMRNLEVDLYWKRSTYCWTLIAALLTICGLLFSAYFKPDDLDKRDSTILIAVGAIALLGVVVTFICQLISVSGEYWKKNWEMHISMLEPLFSGKLYSTHLVASRYRSSISKLNLMLFFSIYTSWALILLLMVSINFSNNNQLNMLSVYISIPIVVFIILFISVSTVSKNKTINMIITNYNVVLNNKSSTKSQLIEIAKRISIKILNAFIFIVVLILSGWILYKYNFNNNAPDLIDFTIGFFEGIF
ncbi:hypothetical protein ACIPT6_00955 [Pectobacterium sp. CHL-2024]